MAFHETYWVITGSAAPVLGPAAVLSVGDVTRLISVHRKWLGRQVLTLVDSRTLALLAASVSSGWVYNLSKTTELALVAGLLAPVAIAGGSLVTTFAMVGSCPAGRHGAGLQAGAVGRPWAALVK
jgi:hypothetical protein